MPQMLEQVMNKILACCTHCGATIWLTGDGTKYRAEQPIQHSPNCKQQQ